MLKPELSNRRQAELNGYYLAVWQGADANPKYKIKIALFPIFLILIPIK
jgi:hypothetical protein